jgi:hypothetical protein
MKPDHRDARILGRLLEQLGQSLRVDRLEVLV